MEVSRTERVQLEAYGGALYELGLVPDFELLQDPTKTPQRLARNRDCVAKLTWSPRSERGRVLDLGLTHRAFRNQLGDFVAEAGLEDPRAWTRRIVMDRSLWPLAFNRWEFEDGGQEPDAIFVGDTTTDLPKVPEDEAVWWTPKTGQGSRECFGHVFLNLHQFISPVAVAQR